MHIMSTTYIYMFGDAVSWVYMAEKAMFYSSDEFSEMAKVTYSVTLKYFP